MQTAVQYLSLHTEGKTSLSHPSLFSNLTDDEHLIVHCTPTPALIQPPRSPSLSPITSTVKGTPISLHSKSKLSLLTAFWQFPHTYPVGI